MRFDDVPVNAGTVELVNPKAIAKAAVSIAKGGKAAVTAIKGLFKRGKDAGAGRHADDVSDDLIVVCGGTGAVPPPGRVFSGAAGRTLEEAASGVPHGQIRSTTAGLSVRVGAPSGMRPSARAPAP